MDPSRLRRRLRTLAALFGAAAAGLGLTALAATHARAGDSDSLTVTIVPKDAWPPAPVTDLVGTPGAEGQMLLSWTAPDSNSNMVGSSSPAAGYIVRLATFSVDSVGSTTTWWNAAFDATGMPTPSAPGVQDSLLLSDLEPGATFYAAIRSSDAIGNFSLIDVKSATAGQQASTLVFDAVPPAPAAASAVVVASRTILVAWSSVSAADLHYYKVYVDSTSPYDFADSFAIAVDSSVTSFLHTGLASNTTYFYAVKAVDKGAPNYAGYALESSSTVVFAVTENAVLRPKAPIGLRIQASSTTLRLDWMPVRRYETNSPFSSYSSCTASELSGYRVYRATTPVMADWTELVTVSSSVLTYTDPSAGPQYYYHLKSENLYGLSQPSLIRAYTGPAYVVGSDQHSVLEIPIDALEPLLGWGNDPETSYSLGMSTQPFTQNRSFKAVAIVGAKGGVTEAPDLELTAMGTLRLYYDRPGTIISGLSTAGQPAVVPAPANMSVFWNNGSKWVQLFGKVDSANQSIVIQTKYLGEYQLRSVERTTDFAFDKAGISNRFLTPNGDGKNDTVVFTFNNPRASDVSAKIFDMQGKLVTSSLTPGPVSDSLVWDGKAGGSPVPAGVYIYRIESEGKSFTGTVIVIR